ncbi:hypothetical protein DY000_02046170 [Brassica cretica]|uniref:Uncharacterized protein n=1 Tax=Brassica cretica TaxID=69181 RepID=A0ABQ7ESL4_BRACR|nr:hypothetical protein DY000_02046170 [Brassica cretica]
MDKRRCLRHSGQFTVSSVFLCLLLQLLKDPDLSGDVGIARSFVPLLCDVSAPFDGSLLLSRLLMGAHRDGTGVELLKPPLVSACYPPVLQLMASHCRVWITGITVCHLLEITASGVDSTASDGRTRVRSTLLRLFYGSNRLRDGSGIISLAVSTANFKIVHGTVKVVLLKSRVALDLGYGASVSLRLLAAMESTRPLLYPPWIGRAFRDEAVSLICRFSLARSISSSCVLEPGCLVLTWFCLGSGLQQSLVLISGGRRRVSTRRSPPQSLLCPVSPLSRLGFSTSFLLHLLWFSSDSGRIRRTKPASEGILSFPGISHGGSPEWISVAAFAFPDPDLSGDVGIARSFVPLLCDVSAPFDGSLLLSRLLMGAHRDGTGVELLKPSLVSACYPLCFNSWLLIVGFGLPGSRFVIFLRLQRLEWTLPLVMAGPGRGQPCFAYSTVRVTFGTVCGPLDCSPAVFFSGLCGFDVGSDIFSLAVSTANFKVVHGFVSIS